MSVIHAPEKPKLDPRLLIFPGAMAALLGILFLRLWYFQVVRAPDLARAAEESREIGMQSLAPRGLIYGRNGELLAGIRSEVVVTAVPSQMKEHPEVLDRVASMLGVPKTRLERRLNESYRPYLPTPIYAGATVEQGVRIAEASHLLPGIDVETQPMRYYPDSTNFTHVLGYVWVPNQRDVDRLKEQGVQPAELVGKAGIEKALELDLMGVPGDEILEVDAKGKPIRVSSRLEAEPGSQITLTIDSKLQKLAGHLFGQRKFRGGLAAIDPKTGEILALVSSPTFDQSLFKGGISETEWEQIVNHPDKPMIDRAIYSAYAPGSTFKIVTSLAAYRAGVWSPYRTVNCRGGVKMGNRFFGCLGVHGPIGFRRAMAVSCNSYFYTLGYQAGADALRAAAKDLGLGQYVGIEIGGEGKGVIPTLEWLRAVSKKENPPWYGGDTMNFSIGQGYVATTPLQMAQVAAIAANRGVGYQPHLVKSIRRPGENGEVIATELKVAHRVEASDAFWNAMSDALGEVARTGTAARFKIPGVSWGGKTGSAQHGSRAERKTHSWFVLVAPLNDPKIAIGAMVEEGGHGGDAAAPIAVELAKAYLREKGLVSSEPVAP